MVAAVAADEPTLPFMSQALASIVTGPFGQAVVSQFTVYGELVAVPTRVVLTQNSTLAMAMVSVTVALKDTGPANGLAGTVSVTTGGAPSVGAVAPRSMRP